MELTPLVDLVNDIFQPSRFKRVYARDKNIGVPFLTPSLLLAFRPRTEDYIVQSHAERHNLFVKDRWLLITRSGTIGRGVITNSRLKDFAVSDDIIRIEVADDIPLGYLHTYMQSWIGQSLITKDKYGSTVKHLEVHHIAGIPVPIIPEHEQQHFQSLIDEVYSYRDDANRLLDNAEKQLYRKLTLADFEADEVGYIPPSEERGETPYYQVARMTLKAFSTEVNELHDRFDASFHIPSAKSAINLMQENCPYPIGRIGDIASNIIVPPRFKRTYVSDPKYGIPFIQGSHILQSRYYGLQYLSRTNTSHIEKWIVKRRQVLVTCSGTIGHIGMVTDTTTGWAATQHILRITMKDGFNLGYVAAFLMSPYGQCQLQSKKYGAVVKELTESDTANIMIPHSPKSIQDDIGNKVIEAFEKIDLAATLEEDAIHELEKLLESKSSSKSFLATARELKLDGPKDWSSRIEDDLYGKPFDIRP